MSDEKNYYPNYELVIVYKSHNRKNIKEAHPLERRFKSCDMDPDTHRVNINLLDDYPKYPSFSHFTDMNLTPHSHPEERYHMSYAYIRHKIILDD